MFDWINDFSFFGVDGDQKDQEIPKLPGIFGWNPGSDPEWDRTDTIVLSVMIGAVFLKMFHNWMLTGDWYVIHPEYTEPGFFFRLFDVYDPTSDLTHIQDYSKQEEDDKIGFSYDDDHQNDESWWDSLKNIFYELKIEISHQSHKRLNPHDRMLLKTYPGAQKEEELSKLPEGTLHRLRNARALEYDHNLLFKKWRSKHELPDQGARVEFWRDFFGERKMIMRPVPYKIDANYVYSPDVNFDKE